MHLSSILVVTRPTTFTECEEGLASLPGVQIRLRYPEVGRFIVVQESPSGAGQEEGLRRIQASPHVVAAGLMYHFIEAEESSRP